MIRKTKKKKWWKDKDLRFYSLMMAYPVLQFLVFYVGVNINAILLAFQKIDMVNNKREWTFSTLSNAFSMMTGTKEMLNIMSMSFIVYALGIIIGLPLGLFFSYYIYKKLPFYGGFRVLLFLPSIVSSIVLATIYQFFFERAIPAFALKFFDTRMIGLMENPDTRFATIYFFITLVGFGTSVLMYSDSMNGISPELTEAAQIDGASAFQEFWRITLPMIFPTLKTFLVVGVAGIFTNQLQLYAFYGPDAPRNIITYGYYFYTQTKMAQTSDYPLLSAMGLLMTLVAVPITLIIKRLLDKYGPSED